MHIFDEDPAVQSLLDKAAVHLNRTGCLNFLKTVKLLRKYANFLSVVETGKGCLKNCTPHVYPVQKIIFTFNFQIFTIRTQVNKYDKNSPVFKIKFQVNSFKLYLIYF